MKTDRPHPGPSFAKATAGRLPVRGEGEVDRGQLRLVMLVLTAALLATLSCDEGEETAMCEIGCGEGLGFPCPCNPEDGCSEGAVCGAVSVEHQVGFCSIPCVKDSDCVWEADCTGKRRCILENETSGGLTCALTCRTNKDCPLNMSCAEVDGLKVCYPWVY